MMCTLQAGVLRQRADLNTCWKQLACRALEAAKLHDVLWGQSLSELNMTKIST